MSESKLFSVAMCVYSKDDPVWFHQTVDSLLNQTAPPAEIILVVDGPVPEKLNQEIVRCEEEPLFCVVRLPENVGHGNARRISLSHCNHELVAIMDADDICVPDRFEKQLAIFESDPTLAIVGGNIAEFTTSVNEVIGHRVVPSGHDDIVTYMKTRCPFNQMTVMFKKSEIEEVGGYQDWYCNEDYFLWVRLLLGGKRFANTPDVLVQVRVDENLYKRRGGWKYFKSEAKLQKLMYKEDVICLGTYLSNVAIRLFVQVLMPNSLRAVVFKTFFRSKELEKRA